MTDTRRQPAAAAPPLVEACCDSVDTARVAQSFGAGRVELCGPGDGGSTPSLGLIARCRDALTIPLHVMIRPHLNGFVYRTDDFDVMCDDVVAAKVLGADGVVAGPLNLDGTVCTEQLAELIELARPMRVAFHRAFDRTPDAMSALDTLLDLGVDYILTAGHARTALEGALHLRRLQERAGHRLVVLAGGNVRGDTVRELVDRAQVREVHARASDPTIVRGVVQALTSR